MNYDLLLYVGGGLHILFAIFDLFWWRIFNWSETLAPLDQLNQSLLKIVNKLIVFIYLAFASISLFFTQELQQSNLGRYLLVVIAGYWLIRTILEPVFFSLKEREHAIFFVIFIIMVIIYAMPVLHI